MDTGSEIETRHSGQREGLWLTTLSADQNKDDKHK